MSGGRSPRSGSRGRGAGDQLRIESLRHDGLLHDSWPGVRALTNDALAVAAGGDEKNERRRKTNRAFDATKIARTGRAMTIARVVAVLRSRDE